MIESRAFQPLHLVIVVGDLSDQHLGEVLRSGHGPTEVFESFTLFAELGHAETIFLDGRPVAVFAWAGGRTWFVASKSYFAAGAPMIRHSRRVMREAVDRAGALTALTLSDHPDLDRWMRILGGELKEDRGATKFYIFR